MQSQYLEKHDTRILVEGPAWGDAEFYGNWLLMAAKANELLQEARNGDSEFRKSIETLEMLQCLDFGIMATVFLSQFVDNKFYTLRRTRRDRKLPRARAIKFQRLLGDMDQDQRLADRRALLFLD